MVEATAERPELSVQKHDQGPECGIDLVMHLTFCDRRVWLTLCEDGETSMARSFKARPFMPKDSAACRSMEVSLASKTDKRMADMEDEEGKARGKGDEGHLYANPTSATGEDQHHASPFNDGRHDVAPIR